MAANPVFSDVVDLVDRLTLDEKESLLDVLQKRTAEERRGKLIAEVKKARREFRAGRGAAMTPEQIMREALR